MVVGIPQIEKIARAWRHAVHIWADVDEFYEHWKENEEFKGIWKWLLGHKVPYAPEWLDAAAVVLDCHSI